MFTLNTLSFPKSLKRNNQREWLRVVVGVGESWPAFLGGAGAVAMGYLVE
jgi:hypothetical protein